MTGAACLSARAAFRADAGYVTLAVPVRVRPRRRDAGSGGCQDRLEGRGRGRDHRRSRGTSRRARPRPGAGARARTSCARAGLLETVDLPAVVDADALFELEPFERAAPTVLTPHAGELARLLDTDVGVGRRAPARGRSQGSRALSAPSSLLKGSDTIVVAPGSGAIVCDLGPPALATAGTGDVLTGITAAFLAKGLDAAARGRSRRNRTWPRGTARAPPQAGLVASDLLDLLPRGSRRLSRRGAFELHARSRSDPAQRGDALARRRRRRAVGRRQGERIRARRAPTSRTLRSRRRVRALRGDGGRGARAPGSTRSRRRTHHRHGPGQRQRAVAAATFGAAGARLLRRTASRGRPAAPEDRHGHGQMGPVRASRSDEERRRRHEPSRCLPSRTRTSRACRSSAFARRPRTSSGTLVRHLANSAGTLRYPAASFDAVRCGIALYGISPFGSDPALDGLEPALRWESYVALAKRLEPGDSTGYGRRFVADEPTWIGVVPVGYADGFRRDMTGTEVLVDGERRRVVGTVSMDAIAVELDHEVAIGTPVTLVGDGILDRGARAGRGDDRIRDRHGARHQLYARTAGDQGVKDARIDEILAGEEAWIVGGAVRDSLLGRPVLDVDVACREPRAAANRFAKRFGGAPFPLSERHGAWRVVTEGSRRDRRLHAASRAGSTPISRRATSRSTRSPFGSGVAMFTIRTAAARDLEAGVVRAVSETVFHDDPLRLLASRPARGRAGLPHGRAHGRVCFARRLRSSRESAGERVLGELRRLSPAGYRRLDEVGLLEPLGGSLDGPLEALDDPDFRLVAVFGERLRRLPISREQRRYAAALAPRASARGRVPAGDSPLSTGDRAVGAGCARVSRRDSELSEAVERGPARRSARAPRARRRARSGAGSRDRTYPRDHRRGARSRNDLHARASSRARSFSRDEGAAMSVRAAARAAGGACSRAR